jgi:hypothetical protein
MKFNTRFFTTRGTPALCLLAALAVPGFADEGMWLFNNFPAAAVESKYKIKISPDWLAHVQRAAVRFNSGGTGSFVSPDGLLFTNHHVAADCIAKLASAQNDYIKNGFSAASPAAERKCPDLEVNVLVNIEDVTSRVNSGIATATPAAEANQKRKAAMSAIEKDCNASTGNRCDVVTLFSGGLYHLYQYKKYTDIRLVFAPEFGIAFFGGDPENFTYPRYNLDITFFRAYENDKPVKPQHWFRWSREGAKENEVVFVPGNPGSTGRLSTVAELEFYQSAAYPLILRRLNSQIDTVKAYMALSDEQRRVGNDVLFGAQNSFKAMSGFQRGLNDPSLMGQKRADEKKFREAIAADPVQREKFGRLWDEIATAWSSYRKFYPQYAMYESYATRGSAYLALARGIVRYAEEKQKPGPDRLREYVETALPARELAMFSPAPITPSLEIAILADYFTTMRNELGASDEVVRLILEGREPLAAAQAYVSNSKLQSIDERKRLANDAAAMRASGDSMIVLARILDAPARKYRKMYEDTVESIVTRASADIAQARFALTKGNTYPDATFTLRIAYGDTSGYKNDKAESVPWSTTIGGLYPKGASTEPFVIPQSWLNAKAKLNLKTPFNFVSTADTHGGNSGSATINARGEVVGILFDGNIEGLPNRFLFTDRQARSVHVASQAVIEALRSVYANTRLLNELGFEK